MSLNVTLGGTSSYIGCNSRRVWATLRACRLLLRRLLLLSNCHRTQWILGKMSDDLLQFFFMQNETSRFTNLKHFVALAFRSRWRKVYVFADIGAAGYPGSDRMFPSSTSGLSASDALRGRQKRDKLVQARTSSYKLVRKLQLHGLAGLFIVVYSDGHK